LATLAILATCLAVPAVAQQSARTAIEFNAGPGFGGSSAPHVAKGGLAVDALVAMRTGARAGGGFVVALSGSGQPFGVAVSCDVVPGGTCTPEFPEFWVVSVLAGWETAGGRARILVGPGVASAESTLAGAAQGRIELTQPLTRGLSLLASARLSHIPSYQGESFRLAGFGLGVRIR